MGTPRAVIYTRVSTENQAQEGTSLEAQELACLRKAAERGAPVVAIHRDPGVSGALFLSRPGIQAALRDVEEGRANLLIAYKLDRAGRDVDALREIRRRMLRAGGELVLADGMEFSDSPTGNLMFTQLGAFAEFEKAVIRERTMAGKRRRIEEGQQVFRGRFPYGYAIVLKGQEEMYGTTAGTYVIREDQADAVREIFTRYDEGESLNGIARWLQLTGVPTPRGGHCWRPQALHWILRNPVYKGEPASYRMRRLTDDSRLSEGYKRPMRLEKRRPEEWVSLEAPAIVDRETWDRCQEKLSTAQAMHGGRPEARYMLSTLLRCPECGRGMYAATKRSRKGEVQGHYYRCKYFNRAASSNGELCSPTHYRGDVAEQAVLGVVLEAARRPERIEDALRAYEEHRSGREDTGSLQALQDELRQVQDQEKAAVRSQIAGVQAGADPTLYDGIFRELAAKRASIQEHIGRLEDQDRRSGRSVLKPRSAAEKVATALRAVEEMLTDPAVPAPEKHKLLALVIREIRPVDRSTYAVTFAGEDTFSYVPMYGKVSETGEVEVWTEPAPIIRAA